MSLPNACGGMRVRRAASAACLFATLLCSPIGIADTADTRVLTIAGDWLVASGLDGFPAAFAGMARESIPAGCDASTAPDSAALSEQLRNNLAGAIPPSLPEAVAPWLQSEVAARVRKAESSLASVDDAAYQRLREQHHDELTSGSPRLERIRTIIAKTRVARLDTVMFNELEMLERMYAQCGDSEALQTLWQEIGEQRARDDLVSFFLGFNLVESTLLMFRDLGQDDLDAYVAFVESPAGAQWHELLVDAVARTLFEERARLYHDLLP